MRINTYLNLIVYFSFLFFCGISLQAQDEALKFALEMERTIQDVAQRSTLAFVQIGGGSGVVISPDGYIVTNYHVTGAIKKWKVAIPTSQGSKLWDADIVGTDPRGDISLLKLKNADGVPYLPIADSDSLTPGQLVIAMGNPYLYGKDGSPSFSLGVVSAIHIYQDRYSDCIQHDAAINPGNSGGPLLNLKGEVVGINGRIAVRFMKRKNTGVGYAITSNQVKLFLPFLKKGGSVSHGTIIGLSVSNQMLESGGVLVDMVSPKTDASEAGFQKGDIILEIDKKSIYNYNRYLGVIGIYPAGTALAFKIQRNGEVKELNVKLSNRLGKMEAPSAPDRPYLGIRISTTYSGPGVEVESLIPESGADKAGIQPGDIITGFGGVSVRDLQHLSSLISKRKIGDKVRVNVLRGEESLQFTVTLGKRENQ